jgi:copper chaperone CopZ
MKTNFEKAMKKILIALTTLTASLSLAQETKTQLTNGLNHIVIPVEGMSCVSCAIAVRHALKRVDGVKSAHVSVATKSATIDYEAAKTNPEQLVSAINSTGYRASLPNKLNDFASMAKNNNTNDTKTDPAPASAGESAVTATANQISLFKVSLQCPAAPQIGCGSAAKLILLDLERQPGVAEAWLNRAGTTIAVVSKSEGDPEARGKVAAQLKEDNATELQGKSRDEDLNEFLSGKGWYRGAEVDRLSEEEAAIVAARFVRRVETKTTLPKEKAEALRRALADAIAKRNTDDKFISNRDAVLKLEDELRQVAGQYLDAEQLPIFNEAIARGWRPLPNEMNDSGSMAKSKDGNEPKADQISLFKVSLQCPAAPQIGCGSAAKPILLDLERQPAVREAWLNRAGTTIAVVWKSQSDAETRRDVTAELKEDHATEVEGAPRDENLKAFLSGKGWYRGADVDRLSEEEAGVIAARFIGRVQAKTALATEKAEGLQHALTDALRKKLTGDCCSPNQKQSRLEDVAREYLNQDQIKVLTEAIEKGVRPLPNES